MFERFRDAGLAVAGIDVGESYGSPAGRRIFSLFYGELVQHRGLSRKVGLLARSRGGLMLYNWAVEHPEAVACVAGIYPVCNVESYPGLKTACTAYGMTEDQLRGTLAQHNPVDRIAPLARAGVPIFHIHGNKDSVVPLDENSAELARRYHVLGGAMTIEVVKGGEHDYWSGWFKCGKLVDFMVSHLVRASQSDSP